MIKYDDASWHHEGDFPKDLQEENAATHIGMYLTWCIENDFLSDQVKKTCKNDVENVKKRTFSGAEFLLKNCDQKLTEDDLNQTGQDFTAAYYDDEADFAKSSAAYLLDYCVIFEAKAKEAKTKLNSVYHVEDTWDNYNLLKTVIDERFEEWKKYVEEKKETASE